MKRQLLLASALVLSSLAAHAASVTANSKITDVTVYQDRALVTRSTTVHLDNGEQQVVFEDLPVNLDENSVRARGTGNGFKILGVEIRRDYKKIADSDQVKKFRDQIKDLQQKNQDLEDESNDLTQKRELLNKLSENIGSGNDKTPPSVNDIKTFTDYYGSQVATISTRIRAIERLTVTNNEQIEDLSKQLQQVIQPTSSDKRTVVVTVDASSKTDADIQVDYLIYGCSWIPQYDAHYQSGSKNVNFTAYGVISQNTGENWDGVKMTLSTSRPQQGTSLPDLTSWTVDVQHLQPVMQAKSAPELRVRSSNAKEISLYEANLERKNSADVAVESETDYDGVTAQAPAPIAAAQMMTANVEISGFSAVYKVPATVSVPSDGQPHRCTISIQEMSAEQSYASTPKLIPGAFVKAKVKNANAAPLLPGQLNIFMDNDFVGSSQFSFVGPEGIFDLFLGKDDSIKVQRKDKTRKVESSGMFTKSKVVKMGYTIELENFQNKDVTVSLKDQVPVSQNEKIKISYKSSLPESEYNKETGELTWKITIPAKKKVAVDVDFQAEFPPDVVPSGI